MQPPAHVDDLVQTDNQVMSNTRYHAFTHQSLNLEIRAAMTDLTRAFTSFSRLSAFFINKFEAKHHFCSKNFVRLFLFCSVVFKF